MQHNRKRGDVWILAIALVLMATLVIGQFSFAQTQTVSERKPFDVVILKNKERHNVEPIPFKNRVFPAKRPKGKLALRVIEDPDEEYEIDWALIDAIIFYEDTLMKEAVELTVGGKYDEAYDHFAFILSKYPKTRGLDLAINTYLFLNAGELNRQKKHFEALAMARELYGRNPKFSYQGGTLIAAANEIARPIAQKYIGDKNYERAQEFIIELRKSFPNETMSAADEAVRILDAMAAGLRDQAKAAMDGGNLRKAQQVSRQMLKIWPEVAGAKELLAEIDRRYPLFYVGVTQKATFSARNRIDNWPARRTGYLTGRNIMEFLGSGPEFGKYESPLGVGLQSYDRKMLTLVIDPKRQQLDVTGYDMARHFLKLSDPKSKLYNSAWASLMESVDVEEVYRLNLRFRRPNIRPESLLQLDISDTFSAFVKGKGVGPFVMADDKDKIESDYEEVRFVANPASPFRKSLIPGVVPPAEIVERTFEDGASAVAALKRGEIDVLDYVMPALVPQLQRDESISVVAYGLPTVHMLIPNYREDKPYSRSVMFRRSLLYGLRRDAILKELLLRDQKLTGYQILSGPFSISLSEIDPSGYAYDEGLEPRKFDPRTALTLIKLTEQRTRRVAEKKKEKPPKLEEMVIAYPDEEVARIACEAIAFQWNAIPDTNIKCVLKKLPPGKTLDPKKEYDFLYARVAMWEPLRDARRLLSLNGLVGVTDDHVNRALQNVDFARSEKQLRERMQDLHRITNQSVSIVPLWQTVDYFAHRRNMRRRLKSPLSLYEDVLSWQMNADKPGNAVSSR